jgi:hypothetical protein
MNFVVCLVVLPFQLNCFLDVSHRVLFIYLGTLCTLMYKNIYKLGSYEDCSIICLMGSHP